MERLKRDIPKFLDNSRVISPENKQWWANLFANKNKTYSNTERVDESQKTWLLDDLRVLKFGRATACEDESISNQSRTAHVDQESTSFLPEVKNISSEITDLVQSQFNNILQVHHKNIINI